MEIEKQFVYRVLDGDTLASLCLKFNTSIENIVRNNKDIPLFAGELVEIKVNDYIQHFVRPAETLKNIAEFYNITTEEIVQTNSLQTEKLYIGQILKIYEKKHCD